MAEDMVNIEFSPILIMDFIRLITVSHTLKSDNSDLVTKFKIDKTYYDELKSFPIQSQFIGLEESYSPENNILTVKATQNVINHFKSQKALLEMCEKAEEQYKERYKTYIELLED